MLVNSPILLFSIIFAIGYLLGSIPFGILLTRFAGLGDLKKIGSGNIGATNVLRTGSKSLAAATLFLDTSKAVAAVIVAQTLTSGSASQIAGLVAGAGAVLGHDFSIWLKFKGGKGVATSLGMMIATTPLIGGMACVTWVGMAIVFRYSSLSALIALAIAPVFAIILGLTNATLVYAAIAVLGWTRHWTNIKRLYTGDEPRIGEPNV